MRLTDAHVTMYKSIEDSGDVLIDENITVLVGQNESGKTAFLEALHKARPIDSGVTFDVVADYPRRVLTQYQKRHDTNPDVVTRLTFQAAGDDIARINERLGFDLLTDLSVTVNYLYNNRQTIIIAIPEEFYVQHIVEQSSLSTDIVGRISATKGIHGLIETLEQADLNAEGEAFLDRLRGTFKPSSQTTWENWLALHIWETDIRPNLPCFLYFDDYYLLPGKINIAQLQQRVTASAQNPAILQAEDRTILALLRMANVGLGDFTSSTSYEEIKAKLEGFSNSITDQIFEYWTQNQELEVEIDIRADPQDQAPYNQGPNLYIRIRNKKHRVSVPFSQRSKGFIWFFSFLVWFGSIAEDPSRQGNLVLLLDEPGLNLHALAQEDFLRYIDTLARDHQLIYTTHSPFMVHSDRLHQVRTVEDQSKGGTKISANVSNSDPKTIFPLQAALGYTIAQNLFISKRNLLVEGPADLIYLQFFSSLLEEAGRVGLRVDVTIVPVGGLDKLATFVALLGANNLDLVVLHDYNSKPDERLATLVREKLIRERQVLNYAAFRVTPDGTTLTSPPSSDVEDLMTPSLYLRLFNGAYKKELGGATVTEADVPPRDRIVERIGQFLKARSIQLKAAGGYNHYLIANYLAAHPIPLGDVDADTLNRFEKLFQDVNQLYTAHDN